MHWIKAKVTTESGEVFWKEVTGANQEDCAHKAFDLVPGSIEVSVVDEEVGVEWVNDWTAVINGGTSWKFEGSLDGTVITYFANFKQELLSGLELDEWDDYKITSA